MVYLITGSSHEKNAFLQTNFILYHRIVWYVIAQKNIIL